MNQKHRRLELTKTINLYDVSSIFIMELRKDFKISFLEEFPLEQLLGAKLHSKKDVLRHYFYHVNVLKKQRKEARKDSIISASSNWIKAGVTLKVPYVSENDLEKIAISYQVLR
jgi:hypothetical protein